jgi:hypothetical protein
MEGDSKMEKPTRGLSSQIQIKHLQLSVENVHGALFELAGLFIAKGRS